MADHLFQPHPHELDAIRKGRLSLIIRPVEPPWEIRNPCDVRWLDGKDDPEIYGAGGVWIPLICPYAPGDVLVVQEPWAIWLGDIDDPLRVKYSDGESYWIDRDSVEWETLPDAKEGAFRSALEMPHWAARYRPVITSVECKPVRGLTWEDWVAAGIRSDLQVEAGMVAARFWNATYAPLGPGYAWDRAVVWWYHIAAIETNVPCCKCGGSVLEFSVPNDTWNTIVRDNDEETDREYLCLDCFARIAAEKIKRLEKKLSLAIEQDYCTMCGRLLNEAADAAGGD